MNSQQIQLPLSKNDVVLISNPLSYTNARHPDSLALAERDVEAAGGLALRAVSDEQIALAVDKAKAVGCRLLIANGGDGTIQGIVSCLLNNTRPDDGSEENNHQPDASLKLAVLPGGRTNVIAADVGMQGPLDELIRRLLDSWRDASGQLEPRATLLNRVENEPDRYGFLINGGGLAAIIESCWAFRERHRRWGLFGGLGTAVWVVKHLLGGLLGRGLFPIVAADLQWNGQPWTDSILAFSLTTNQRLPLGISPYDSAGHSAVKGTAISGHARNIAWRLLAAMFSRGKSFQQADGFISGCPQQVRVTAREPIRFHLDGESYGVGTGQYLIIQAGPVIQFYRPRS